MPTIVGPTAAGFVMPIIIETTIVDSVVPFIIGLPL